MLHEFRVVSSSSNPRKIMVSLYPQACLQAGHGFVNASSPRYHPLTQALHLNNTLQHLVITTGGTIGALKHILSPMELCCPLLPT